ncbi:hypothetical protein Taro_014923 [Colocasia esculenta]|uniref:Uncharacterized protein n=1 Tax=Colocasia esculenta TaxID=4460 RepID=A0A843UKT4_COLES|nr:hypothetical protein [Colocasia esculenta]
MIDLASRSCSGTVKKSNDRLVEISQPIRQSKQESFQTYLRGVLPQKGEDLVLLVARPRSEEIYIGQFFK